MMASWRFPIQLFQIYHSHKGDLMERIKVGEKYGRLTVIKNHHPKDEVTCICECGNIKVARATNVFYGGTKSCGCLFKEGNNLKHGGRGTRIYQIWKGMRERCYTKTCSIYKNYGARGITICEEWSDFNVFKEWALKNGYADDLSIDRIDVNGNYEPSNCKWATMKEQANNTRNNHFLTLNGERKTISQWAEKTGLRSATIASRVRRGWSVEDALTKPLMVTRRFYGRNSKTNHRVAP